MTWMVRSCSTSAAGPELTDWPRLVAELEWTEPWWPPGKGFGYHSWTFGLLVSELARRAPGESIDDLLRASFADRTAGHVSFLAPPPGAVARQVRLDIEPSPAWPA